MAKSPEEMLESMIGNMKDKTGKSLPQWLKIAAGSKLAKHGELVKFLKTDHGMTHGFANVVATKTLQGDAKPASAGELVESQYAGDKSALRPIYEAIIAAVNRFGSDVEVSPKKAYVSLRRAKQFGIIQPSTKTRMDLGLNLKTVQGKGVLKDGDKWGGMCSHHISINSVDDITPEVIDWLRKAYEAAG